MKIKKITKNNNELYVGDIEVNNTHSYQLSNGCVSHNSTSLIFGSGSGVHPHHARKYFRRIQCNKIDNVYQHFAKSNQHAIEESVWSITKTDDVITFPIQVSDNVIVKKDLTAIKHLKYILSTQKNWVMNGRSEACKKNIHHSVSCTVLVDEKEWDEVIKFIFDHKEYFAAVSFLPKTGDKIYKQAPMEEVVTEEDQKKFDELVKNWKKVDYNKMIEHTDNTQMQKEIACASGSCELITV